MNIGSCANIGKERILQGRFTEHRKSFQEGEVVVDASFSLGLRYFADDQRSLVSHDKLRSVLNSEVSVREVPINVQFVA